VCRRREARSVGDATFCGLTPHLRAGLSQCLASARRRVVYRLEPLVTVRSQQGRHGQVHRCRRVTHDRSELENRLDVEVDLDRRSDDRDAAGDHLLPVEREGRWSCGYGSRVSPTCMITVCQCPLLSACARGVLYRMCTGGRRRCPTCRADRVWLRQPSQTLSPVATVRRKVGQCERTSDRPEGWVARYV
jgi:hypothetical protein